MSSNAGPDIVQDGLVFKYDTGDGKSYKGEPTENLAPSGDRTASTSLQRQGYHQEKWYYSLLTNTLGRKDIIKLYVDPSGNTSQPYADFGFQAYKSGGSQVGDVYTITFDYYVAKNTNTPSCIIAYQNGYKTPSSASVATFSAETTVDLDSGWKRVSRTATITAAGATFWRFGLSSDNNETEVYVDNFQVELKSHATPFVDGTRSATQGLLDRTGNSTIDLSNVSFDSNAQITFDGTDDHIELTSNGFGEFNFQTWTVESWVKFDTITGNHVIFSYDYTSHSQPYYSTHLRTNGAGKLYLMWNNGTTYRALNTLNNAVSSGEWYHLVGVYESGRQQIFLNGESLVSSTRTDTITFYNQEVWIGRANFGGYLDGDIKVLRHYNRALTAKEVLQNYRATKSRFS